MSEVKAPKPKGKPRGRPFAKGQSGNPRGRIVGSHNKATVAAQALLDDHADRLTRRAVELADGGDPTALRLCLERIVAPRRERVVQFALPPIKTPADIVRAMGAVAAAIADGAITPGEAEAFARVVDTFMRAIDVSDFERRLQAVEADAARS
jgi:hypothetical protein